MKNRLNATQMKSLKSRFRAAGCAVRDLNDSTFEVVDDDFPVRTHVEAITDDSDPRNLPVRIWLPILAIVIVVAGLLFCYVVRF